MKQYLLIILLIGSIVPAAFAGEESHAPVADEIIAEANYAAYYQGEDGRARVNMTITDSRGRERKREFTILRKDNEKEGEKDESFTGDQKFYVYFHLPADVNKMVFMVWKHVDEDDDRWLYLPALDLVKRIASTEERTSFAGSHFFYEDVSGRTPSEDTHELVETTDDYYVLIHHPKDPKKVEFKSYKTWIHKKSFMMVKAEYYDENDEKYREYQALEVDTIEGFPTVTKAVMKDLEAGGRTTIEYNRVTYGVGLPDDIFTERYLRRPPMKYLK